MSFFMKVSKIKIDPEFAALIPALAPEEFALLESSIVSEDILIPLVVWSHYYVPGAAGA